MVEEGEGGSIKGGYQGGDSLTAQPIRGYGGALSGGIDAPDEDNMFVYMPPEKGKPLGDLPDDWVFDDEEYGKTVMADQAKAAARLRNLPPPPSAYDLGL